MHVKIYTFVLKYWAGVNHELKDNPIIMDTLDANMKLSQSNKNSWFSTVHHLLKSVDQLSAWEDPSTIKSIDSFGLSIKKSLDQNSLIYGKPRCHPLKVPTFHKISIIIAN